MESMVTAPGAFLLGRSQMEQNAFNWVLVFHEDVHVLRDRAHNVAYWNLHERSLRWSGFDGGANTWTVEGRPLVSFHFSGFDPRTPLRLSRHDHRYPLHTMPSLARLCELYAEQLREAGADHYSGERYGFGAFPSGVPIDTRMRDLFKLHEEHLYREIDPWTPEGEAHYCEALLSPVPYTQSLVPVLLREAYENRPDLAAAYPEAHLKPESLVSWFVRYGAKEYGYQELIDRHRPTRPTVATVTALASALRSRPQIFEGLERPCRDERSTFLLRLASARRPRPLPAAGVGQR
jgi:hypothetical protein